MFYLSTCMLQVLQIVKQLCTVANDICDGNGTW